MESANSVSHSRCVLAVFFNKPIADQTSCTQNQFGFHRHFRLGPKSNSPAAKPVFKFELLGDFAMSEMRFRNDRETAWSLTSSALSIRQTSSSPPMYEKVTPVTVRNRTLR